MSWQMPIAALLLALLLKLMLATCLPVLRDWRTRQMGLLQNLGWRVAPSEANFFCAQAPQALDFAHLRQVHGIKLRDALSFGLPGQMRLGVLPPASQEVLHEVLQTPLAVLAHNTPRPASVAL